MDSSQIKREIISITFRGKYTFIKYRQKFQPRGQNEVVMEEYVFKSDNLKHPDFIRAMDKMKAHMIIRAGFAKAEDKLGKLIDKTFFDEHLFEADERFMDAEVTGFFVTTKKDQTGFQLKGFDLTVDEQKVPVVAPVISTMKVDGGYNYPLQDIFAAQVETLLNEAQEFMKYKTGNPQLSIAYQAAHQGEEEQAPATTKKPEKSKTKVADGGALVEHE